MFFKCEFPSCIYQNKEPEGLHACFRATLPQLATAPWTMRVAGCISIVHAVSVGCDENSCVFHFTPELSCGDWLQRQSRKHGTIFESETICEQTHLKLCLLSTLILKVFEEVKCRGRTAHARSNQLPFVYFFTCLLI